jgi:uncharacterized membrane protein YfcA
VAIGALPGSLLGARLSQRVEARSLKIIMAVVLLLVGLRRLTPRDRLVCCAAAGSDLRVKEPK